MLLPSEISDRRKLAYEFKQFDDYNLERIVYNSITDSELVEQIYNFFVSGSTLTYPAKSYFVAIVYAHCMHACFGMNVVDALTCTDLVIEDDFFVPYNTKSKPIYDAVLNKLEVCLCPVTWMQSTKKTVDYFKEEFLIREDELVKL